MSEDRPDGADQPSYEAIVGGALPSIDEASVGGGMKAATSGRFDFGPKWTLAGASAMRPCRPLRAGSPLLKSGQSFT
jgi:hypothetical protein